jgi:hypothetical protein
MLGWALLYGTVITAVIMLHLWLRESRHEWHPDGPRRMRRLVKGKWQYRPATDAERARYVDEMVI